MAVIIMRKGITTQADPVPEKENVVFHFFVKKKQEPDEKPALFPGSEILPVFG